jgi:hypothetical protein
LLADDDPSEDRPSRRGSSFLTVVAIGNVVRIYIYSPIRPSRLSLLELA